MGIWSLNREIQEDYILKLLLSVITVTAYGRLEKVTALREVTFVSNNKESSSFIAKSNGRLDIVMNINKSHNIVEDNNISIDIAANKTKSHDFVANANVNLKIVEDGNKSWDFIVGAKRSWKYRYGQ